MKTIAILPVKSFGAAKQRLSDSLDAERRRELAQAMFTDVLHALGRVQELDAVAVVTAEPLAESLAKDEGVLVLRDTAQTGQSAAALIGIRHAEAEGYERALLVPGDTPLLDTEELAGLMAGDEAVVVVPDRHGSGTNALALTPPGAIEPSFGPGSCARHVAAAERAGAPHRVQALSTLAIDVDTPDDLAALTAELELRPGRAGSTRAALARLGLAGEGAARAPA
jgi:2-phospho-L-lactate guanylyltransferase